nr:kinesin-like protein KIN-4C [Tanacetum cinerariifolium]
GLNLDQKWIKLTDLNRFESPELLVGCSDCISITPSVPQVQIGSAFVYVYGSSAGSTSSCRIFDDCVAPLVDAFFHGYNATVLAYGQEIHGDVQILHSCNGLLLCRKLSTMYGMLYVNNLSITNMFKAILKPDNVKSFHGRLKMAFDPTKSPHYKGNLFRNVGAWSVAIYHSERCFDNGVF